MNEGKISLYCLHTTQQQQQQQQKAKEKTKNDPKFAEFLL